MSKRLNTCLKKRQNGFTLIELFISLTVLWVIVSMGLPGLKQTIDKVAADKVMKELAAGISLAKTTAILENSIVTFCRSNDGQQCQGGWHEGSIIFTDGNGDRLLNEDDRLVYRFQAIDADGELSFNSFGNRQYIQMKANGFTNYQSGNFTYCPAGGSPEQARQLVLNHLGRTRLAQDMDKDGVVENSQGKPLICD